MAKTMKLTALFLSIAFILALIWHLILPSKIMLSLCITFGVFSYHFVMRLSVGTVINSIFHNNISYKLKWFRVSKAEMKFYSFLHLKSIKKHIPTYSPETFSMNNSMEYIAKATCQAELVHEIIAVLSFAPVILTLFFDDALTFILTSLIAALIDLVFVALQRFNRPRILKLIERKSR